jgi:hypothetical protein
MESVGLVPGVSLKALDRGQVLQNSLYFQRFVFYELELFYVAENTGIGWNDAKKDLNFGVIIITNSYQEGIKEYCYKFIIMSSRPFEVFGQAKVSIPREQKE